MTNKPTVSIICTNFNKGGWIREAIEGFLSQKTKFDYEILIIDDASSDISPSIIKEYADKYPDKIRAFYNKKNLGITKTWLKICKKARGRYIARCDGDDYWIDVHKLQKQMDALENAPESKWVNTDFDIVLPDGTVTQAAAFEKGMVKMPSSYEDILATRGFTAPSTWLVESQLMHEVNTVIDKDAVDDTFNIQLELFHRTKLTYLPYPMVAYRMGHESDSRPIDTQKAKQRNTQLLQTQLEYIDKYPEIDSIKALKVALHTNADFDAALIDARNDLVILRKAILDRESTIDEKNKELADMLNSKRYKLGTTLLRPLSFVKSKVNRIKK